MVPLAGRGRARDGQLLEESAGRDSTSEFVFTGCSQAHRWAWWHTHASELAVARMNRGCNQVANAMVMDVEAEKAAQKASQHAKNQLHSAHRDMDVRTDAVHVP